MLQDTVHAREARRKGGRLGALTGLLRTADSTILFNASSLVGTTVLTSALGFVFWWVAARTYTAEIVGLSAAATSAMSLLGNLAVLGLGTLLIAELGRQRHDSRSLIVTALIIAQTAGSCLGLVFVLIAPLVSTDFQPLVANAATIALFAAGIGLTAVTLVLDQALIGLLRGGLQLGRNGLFALAKLVILVLLGAWMQGGSWTDIYGAWVVALVISLLFVAARLRGLEAGAERYRLRWRMILELGRSALQHHVVNVSLQAPFLLMPMIVTALLSAAMTAYFYPALMIAGLVFITPNALTTALYAAGAREPRTLKQKVRSTVALALVAGIVANLGLALFGSFVLGLFGAPYAEEATSALLILAAQVFPLIIKDHYVAIARVRGQVAGATTLIVVGVVFELVLAIAGALLAGLPGLSAGWLVAACLEAGLMVKPVWRAADLAGRPRLRRTEE